MPRFILVALLASTLAPAALASDAPDEKEPFFSVANDEDIGPYIVGPNGRAVYMFDTQTRGGDGLPPLESCGPRCREAWPPLVVAPVTTKNLSVSDGLDPNLAGSVTDGDKLVASYNGHPLFYFNREGESEGPSGHGIHTHGGWWIALAPNGNAIRTGTIPSETDY
ncbi:MULTISPECIES: hypothetical protein [unclassified Roseovarius]|uniref:hypothetical protein n=1 Tax=unclassified Roseovarius TaxID=2614913 RepID=UPI00273D838D|nr:hypothetical protein [Roseovarius sp. MMSF_3350]